MLVVGSSRFSIGLFENPRMHLDCLNRKHKSKILVLLVRNARIVVLLIKNSRLLISLFGS